MGCDVRGRSESVSEPPGEGTCRPSDVYVSGDGSDSYSSDSVIRKSQRHETAPADATPAAEKQKAAEPGVHTAAGKRTAARARQPTLQSALTPVRPPWPAASDATLPRARGPVEFGRRREHTAPLHLPGRLRRDRVRAAGRPLLPAGGDVQCGDELTDRRLLPAAWLADRDSSAGHDR